jgi:hypothetical protein
LLCRPQNEPIDLRARWIQNQRLFGDRNANAACFVDNISRLAVDHNNHQLVDKLDRELFCSGSGSGDANIRPIIFSLSQQQGVDAESHGGIISATV